MGNYTVKEIYPTLQGEGANTGRTAVLCRFQGCNLWSGSEKDRSTAICTFCDTDFVGTNGLGGGKFTSAAALTNAVLAAWPAADTSVSKLFVVCTGGEPLLQMDNDLIQEFHNAHFEIAIETNGTRIPPPGVDWICVSPKAGAELVLRSGNEIKLIFPQKGAEPELFQDLDFQHFFLQPMDGPSRNINTNLAIEYCLKHPQWKLSLQTHKLIGIP